MARERTSHLPLTLERSSINPMTWLSRFTVLIIFLFAVGAQAQLVINPTTTYTAETSNNTSASSMFTDLYFITKQNATVTNGDAVPRNVSKVDIHALYPNNNTKIYAEWQEIGRASCRERV